VSIVAVTLVVIGYIGFVVFIGIEGTRTVRIQTEMSVARKIHSYLVPEIKFENDSYEISGISIASTEMGGDVTDVTEVGEQLCVTIADVSGHGVPAGILMSALKGSLITSLSAEGPNTDNDVFLYKVNSTFHQISSPDMFCTLATVILTSNKSCQIYNAGHTQTIHYHASTKSIDLIHSTGIPVGVLAEMQCVKKRVELQPGDILALFTDGLTESEDKNGKMLGVEPLTKLLPEIAAIPTGNIVRRFLNRASEFGTTDDDRTVMIIKVKT
jgi:serine phosphatase RsbU (regulator of sigma subunit)